MQPRWMPCSAEGTTLPDCDHSEEIPDPLISGATTHDPARRLREGVGAIRRLAAMLACNEEAALAKDFPGAPSHLQLKVEIPKLRITGQKNRNRFTNLPTDDEFPSIGSRTLSCWVLAILTFISEICSTESDTIAHLAHLGLKVARIPVPVTYGIPYKHGRNPVSYEPGVLARIGKLPAFVAYFPDTGADLHVHRIRYRDLLSEWEVPRHRLRREICDADNRALARGVGVDSELALADNDGTRIAGKCTPLIAPTPGTRSETIEATLIIREYEARTLITASSTPNSTVSAMRIGRLLRILDCPGRSIISISVPESMPSRLLIPIISRGKEINENRNGNRVFGLERCSTLWGCGCKDNQFSEEIGRGT